MEFMEKYRLLTKYMGKLGSVLVSFSGGVDSSLLLAAALDALGRERVLAVTATSPIRHPGDLGQAAILAASLGARWQKVESGEMENEEFLANPPDRCYHCKKGLMGLLAGIAAREGLKSMVEGSSLSDINDWRPGFRAVREAGVSSPLAEVGMTKEQIREAARERGIASWNRPSEACLCSRLPYGVRITKERLKRIYSAECVVRNLGPSTARVRDHGEIARLEVPPGDIERIFRGDIREVITKEIKALGFKYVALDLEGYRTGSMNRCTGITPDPQKK